ncbi:MAG: prolyl oligopeptidase family serine peptidase [Herpetosiphon sp.]
MLYCMESLDAEPRVVLDPNSLSHDGTVALSGYAVSEDGRLLAYGLSAAGSDWQEWRVRDIATSADLDDHLQWVKFSLAAWSADNQGFFYSRYAAPEDGLAYKGANYDQQLYYHRLGTSQSDDTLIYSRPDYPEWGFHGEVTEDGHYLVVLVTQGTRRENGVLIKDLRVADSGFHEVVTGFDASYSLVGNDGQTFYFVTDHSAPLGRLIALRIDQPAPEHWQTIVPQRDDVLLDVSLVGERFLATYLHHAYTEVLRFDLDGSPQGRVELPGVGTAIGFGGRRGDNETFYLFTSITTPGVVYRLDLASGASTVWKQPCLHFKPGEYMTRQAFVTSSDGTQVPVFISHRRDVTPSADTPTYLYGYGGFNVPLPPQFAVSNLVWMELGGVYVQACLRGGGEYGKAWHEAGTKQGKQHVFDDFIAVGEWLIASGMTSTPRLAIGGRSNGGLLIGACMTQRPELWGACLPGVGVLDMLRFHLWTIGWAWVSDYGSPDDPEEFRTLLAYSPYHNVRPGTSYPPTLVTTGDHDDRVYPAHSFKFGAALQAAQAGAAPILVRIETQAGHGAATPVSKQIEAVADQWAFLVNELHIETAVLV